MDMLEDGIGVLAQIMLSGKILSVIMLAQRIHMLLDKISSILYVSLFYLDRLLSFIA